MKTVIHDTADIVVKRKSDGHTVLNAHAQLASIAQTVSEEFLKGGIGNKNLFLIRTDKEVNLAMRSATFDLEYLAMTQGVAVEESGTAKITKFEQVTVAGVLGDLEVTIKGTPVNGKAILHDADGTQVELDVAAGKATLPIGSTATDGDILTVSYVEDVTGRVVEMDSTKFAEKYSVEYRTIEYDLDTQKVIADIYFIFDEVVPSGAFDLSLENGSAYTPEINFMVLNPQNSDVFGRIVEVKRA